VPWSKVDMHLDSASFNCDEQKYKFYEGLIYISRRSFLPKDPAQRDGLDPILHRISRERDIE